MNPFDLLKFLSSLKSRASKTTTEPFVRHTPLDSVAIKLPERSQNDLAKEFPELLTITFSVGLYNFAVEISNDLWRYKLNWTHTAKQAIWLVLFVCAAAMNVRVMESAVPEHLGRYGLAYPLMFIASSGVVYLFDWITDSEFCLYLFRQLATDMQKSVTQAVSGVFTYEYRQGRERAFNRLLAPYLTPLTLLSKLKLGTLGVISIAEYSAAIANGIATHEFERIGVLMFITPLVAVLMTWMSGLFKASVIVYPHVKHLLAARFNDLVTETLNNGALLERNDYANRVATEFMRNPDFCREDLDKEQRAQTDYQQQQALFEEVCGYQERFKEAVSEQNTALNEALDALDRQERDYLDNPKQLRGLQLERNHLLRGYCRVRLSLINDLLMDLAILKSSYACNLPAYTQFKATLEQQRQLYLDRQDTLRKEHHALSQNQDGTLPGNKILPFYRDDTEDDCHRDDGHRDDVA